MDIKGNLFLIKPQPDRFVLVSKMPNALGDIRHPAWTIPVIANGTLYLRYMQRLVAYELLADVPVLPSQGDQPIANEE